MNEKKYLLAILLFFIRQGLPNPLAAQEDQFNFSQRALAAKIETLNAALIEASKQKDVSRLVEFYAEDALLLAEYQPLVDGKSGIKQYYSTIFQRQELRSYTKQHHELFNFGKVLLEIGVFEKEFHTQASQKGQYWQIWEIDAEGEFRLAAETFGFFRDLKNPQNLVVDSLEGAVWQLRSREGVQIPLEFDAYSALMENIVRDRDTPKVLELFTEDAFYTPFADTTKTGIENLSTHYYAYHKNPVRIDSIEGSTYDYIPVSDGVIRFTQFYVEWTVPGYSGKNEGTGISYWRRQADNSLKIHRQIAHHTYFK